MRAAQDAAVAAGFVLPADRVQCPDQFFAPLGSDIAISALDDCDEDTVPEAVDNCLYAPNTGQADSGGVASAVADGIGDACQCGDVTGNGIVNGQDANAIRRHALGAEPNPLFAVPGNCDVTGNGVCNGQDANAVKRAALGEPGPTFGQNCHNALGTPVPAGTVRQNMTRLLTLAALALMIAAAPCRVGAQELGPLIAGRSAYVNGTFVWTDYAYDDHGANIDGRPGGDGAGGYPAGLENHADLIQLQIGLSAGEVAIRAILETLVDADTPVLGVAFDSDANPATGAAALPGGAWTPASPLGVDRLVIVRGSGAQLYQFAGVWSLAGSFAASVDPAANTISATVPAALASPGTATWRAFGVLGFADPLLGTSWPEGGAILDLAFVGDERPYLLQTALQGDVLGGIADPALAAAAIDFARVAAGDSELPQPRPGRFETFLHRSALNLPEGVGAASGVIAGGIYLGPYQPYLVWVPDPLPVPAPLLVFLHGASQNHLQDTWVNTSGWPYHGLTPGVVGGLCGQQQAGRHRSRPTSICPTTARSARSCTSSGRSRPTMRRGS